MIILTLANGTGKTLCWWEIKRRFLWPYSLFLHCAHRRVRKNIWVRSRGGHRRGNKKDGIRTEVTKKQVKCKRGGWSRRYIYIYIYIYIERERVCV